MCEFHDYNSNGLGYTRRVPVQRDVERDEIPYRESPRSAAASPITYNGLRVPQPSILAEQQHVGRWAAIRGSTGCINIQKHNYIYNYISRIY